MKKLFVTLLLLAICNVMFSQKLIETPRYTNADFDLSAVLKDSLEFASLVHTAQRIQSMSDDMSIEEMLASFSEDSTNYWADFPHQYLVSKWTCYRPLGPAPKNEQLIRYLTDFYNASTLQRAICSDFDDIITFAEEGTDLSDYSKSVRNFECDELRNSTLDVSARNLIQTYQKTLSGNYDEENLDMLYESFMMFKDDYFHFVKEKILNAKDDDEFDAVFDIYYQASDRDKFIKDYIETRENMNGTNFQEYLFAASDKTTSYDLRCLYLIDCVYYDFHKGESQEPLLPIVLEQTLLEGQYSIFLYNLWNQWRCNKQLEYGGMMRRSSVFFNETYNKMRDHVADVLLRYIDLHPDDTAAIIQFILLADNVNIVRNYTDWSFTNSVMMEIE